MGVGGGGGVRDGGPSAVHHGPSAVQINERTFSNQLVIENVFQ